MYTTTLIENMNRFLSKKVNQQESINPSYKHFVGCLSFGMLAYVERLSL